MTGETEIVRYVVEKKKACGDYGITKGDNSMIGTCL